MRKIRYIDFDYSCLQKQFPGVRKNFFQPELFVVPEIKKEASWGKKLLKQTMNCSVALGIFVLLFYFLPSGVMYFFPQLMAGMIEDGVAREVDAETGEGIVLAQIPENKIAGQKEIKEIIKPEYDLNLQSGQWIEIDSVDIAAEIFTNESISEEKEVEALLEEGVYAYPGNRDYGSQENMVIIAGHHFNSWLPSNERTESFQDLDKVGVGEVIEIIDDQKKWTYKVETITKDVKIEDLGADLVLYTCVFWWDSDLRLFVYADLVAVDNLE